MVADLVDYLDMQHAHLLDYEHFVHTLRSLGAQMHHAQTVHVSLMDAWSEEYRKFHTLQHLANCLHHLEQDRWGGLIDGPDRGRLALALWFSDAICTPQSYNHEEQGAKWAENSMRLLGIPQNNIDIVVGLVLCTKPGARIESLRHAWMHDIIVHNLGLPYEQFVASSNAWRAELSWVDDLNYRRGMDIFLKRFIQAITVFKTEAGQTDYEENANYNISQALQSLHNLQISLTLPEQS